MKDVTRQHYQKEFQVNRLVKEIVSEAWRDIFLKLPLPARIASLKILVKDAENQDQINNKYRSLLN